MTRRARVQVLKFGGAALERPEAVFARVRARRRAGPVVAVVSARAGVTDALERHLGERASRSTDLRLVGWLRQRHRAPGPLVLDRELERLLRALDARRRDGEAAAENVRASGERLAVEWIAELARGNGIPSAAVLAERIPLHVRSDGARWLLEWSRDRTQIQTVLGQYLRMGRVAWVTGYYGVDAAGLARTLGRGGSDLTAVSVAAALGERRAELVKGDRAICYADPVRFARVPTVRSINYATALAVASAPGRVLNAPAIELAAERRMELIVSTLADPRELTRISARAREPTSPILIELPQQPPRTRSPRRSRVRPADPQWMLIGPPQMLRSTLGRIGGVGEVHFSIRSLGSVRFSAPRRSVERYVAAITAVPRPPRGARGSAESL